MVEISLQNLLKQLYLVSPSVLVFAVIFGISNYNKGGFLSKWILLFVVSALMTDILGHLLSYLFNYNLILIPLYGFLELGLIYYLFSKFILISEPIALKYWMIIMLILIMFDVVSVIGVPPKEFQSYGRTIDSLNVVLLCVLYYRERLILSHLDNLKSLLVNTLLLYALSAFLIFLPVNFLVNISSVDYRHYFWLFHFIVTMIFYFILIRILWKSGRSPRPSSSG